MIEERYDDETGESLSFVVFNSVKFMRKTKVQYTGKERRKGNEWRANPEKYGSEQRAKARGERERRFVTVGQEMARGAVIMMFILFAIVFGLFYIVGSLSL